MKYSTMTGFLATVALLGSLSACSSETTGGQSTGNTSGGTSSSSEKLNLQLWHYYNANTKDSFDLLVKEFNDTVGAEEGIQVEAYSYSGVSDLASALVSSANKEVGMPDLPHIFAAYTDTALLLDEMGVVANMDEYFTPDELSLFQQDFLEEGRFDSEGNLKMIQVAKSTELLFVNETDFQEFADATGADLAQAETWEGLADLGEMYYQWTDSLTPEVEHDGNALFGVDSEANFMLVAARSLGEEMYDYNGDSVSFGLSQDSAKSIWDNLFVPYIKGHYATYGGYRSDDVKSGDLLMYVGSTSSVYYFPTVVELGREDAYEIEGRALTYPYFAEGSPVAVQQGAGMVVSKTTAAEEEAATTFLKWFTSAENNLDFAVSTGYIPVQNQALSLNGVLDVLKEEGEISQVVESSLEVTYNEALSSFEFYSNKPFDGSYDTRQVLSTAVLDTVATAREQRDAYMAEGMSWDEAVEAVSGDEAFSAWYQWLSETISSLLS